MLWWENEKSLKKRDTRTKGRHGSALDQLSSYVMFMTLPTNWSWNILCIVSCIIQLIRTIQWWYCYHDISKMEIEIQHAHLIWNVIRHDIRLYEFTGDSLGISRGNKIQLSRSSAPDTRQLCSKYSRSRFYLRVHSSGPLIMNTGSTFFFIATKW